MFSGISVFEKSCVFCKKVAIFFVLIFLLALSPTYSVGALDASFSCESAVLNGNNVASSFLIDITCVDVESFVNSGSALTNETLDLYGIKLITSSQEVYPNKATIESNVISLEFYFLEYSEPLDVSVRDIRINSNILVDSFGQQNTQPIDIPTSVIEDKARPYGINDSYDMDGGTLNILPGAGVLENDIEMQGATLTAEIKTAPLYGEVVLRPDGSFTYTSFEEYPAGRSDTFTYIATDGNENDSDQVSVTIDSVKARIIESNFYRVCDECNTEVAGVGSVIRVDITTDKPLDMLNTAAIIAQNNVSTKVKADDLHYYFEYTLAADDVADDIWGNIRYSISARDVSGNTVSYNNAEDSLIFDKTPPVIYLNDSDYLIYYIGENYDECATAVDDISGEVSVLIDGGVDMNVGGIYVLTYRAMDEAGNKAQVLQKTIKVIDLIPPIISINNIGKISRGDSLLISGTTNEMLKSIQILIKDKIFNVPSENISTKYWFMRFNTEQFELGKNDITVFAFDLFDNFASSSSYFIVSNKPIVIDESSPIVYANNNNIYVYYSNDTSQQNTPKDNPVSELELVEVPMSNYQKNNFNLVWFGINWYYWLIMVPILLLLVFWIFGK